jgi:transposase-like protein
MAKRRRRAFTEEFKAQAVRVVRESGKSIGTVARELDLTEGAGSGNAARRRSRNSARSALGAKKLASGATTRRKRGKEWSQC